MSYDITIGEGRPEGVREIEREDAPNWADDCLTGKGNHRHPGYSQWSEFCGVVGLEDLFFNPRNGLMRKHPGKERLTAEHAAAVKTALVRWNARHAVPAGWGEGEDPMKARLIWLDYWTSWAVAHCAKPTIENT